MNKSHRIEILDPTDDFIPPDAISFERVVATSAGGVWPAIAFLLSVFFSLNLLLAVFNLIPVPPLDGSGAVPLLLSNEATQRYQQFIWGQPAFAWLGILVAWQLFDRLFQPIWLLAVNLIHPNVWYG